MTSSRAEQSSAMPASAADAEQSSGEPMTSLRAQRQPAPPPGGSVLAGPVRAEIEDLLLPVDEHLARAYPGARPTRQPVHTVYVPADRYHAGLAHEWGRQAVQMLEGAGGMTALLECAEVPAHLHEAIAQKVHAKLTTEPIEDLRIDFEEDRKSTRLNSSHVAT